MFASAAAPRPADLMISGGLLIAALVEALITHSTNGPTWLVVAASIVTIVPLAWRRTYPLPAVLAAVIAIVIPVALGLQADGLALAVANLVAVHAVNAYADLTTAAIGTLTMGAAHLVSVVTSDHRVPGDLIWTSVFILLATGSGQVTSATIRVGRAAAEAAEREAVAAERRAVAADLHDVIAHGLALMVVQSGAAASVIDRDPERAKRLLEAVQATGERSAGELQNLLAVLAQTGASPTPARGLSDLPLLFDEARAGGANAQLTMSGDPRGIPDGLSHAGYRIVQEAVTNAIKHAPGTDMSAVVSKDATGLGIVVENHGSDSASPHSLTGGHGLAAMRERAALFGGTLESGPTGHGWRTTATFPVEAVSAGGA